MYTKTKESTGQIVSRVKLNDMIKCTTIKALDYSLSFLRKLMEKNTNQESRQVGKSMTVNVRCEGWCHKLLVAGALEDE